MKVLDQPAGLREPSDFSLVLGGPLYQLWRRTRLSGDAMELLVRRIVVLVLITWLPLLILSALGGHAAGIAIKVPFLRDIEAHVRFLVALPLLILAEPIVHIRTRAVARRFIERGIVMADERPALDAAVDWAVRARNSVSLEIALLITVWTVGHWLWRSEIALDTNTWYFVHQGDRWTLTPAGYWYSFVSIPIFQFLLLRWLVRLFIWFALLFRVSRLPLRLMATHPDRAGGLGFLGKASYAFGPILASQGALLAGLIANRVLYEGENLLSFKMEAAALVACLVSIFLGPLVMFTPRMAVIRRQAMADYGRLASHYAQGFEEKWIGGGRPRTDELLGTADIQSLADLGNSYDLVRQMRMVPFSLEDVTRLAMVTAAPLVPLGLLVLSLEDLILRLAKILF
jgi:hypothetical protein